MSLALSSYVLLYSLLELVNGTQFLNIKSNSSFNKDIYVTVIT